MMQLERDRGSQKMCPMNHNRDHSKQPKQSRPVRTRGERKDLETSDSLISGAREYDPQSWNRIVNLYTPLIDYWIRKRGIKGDEVENIRQEVFVRLSRSIGNFKRRSDGGSFRGYLRIITENLIRSYYRKDRVEAAGGTGALQMLQQIPVAHDSFSNMFDSYSGEANSPNSFCSIENGILFRRIMNWVHGNCSQKYTDVFTSVVLENRPPRDVARDMNISVGSVYQAKSRILSSIREQFNDLV